MRQQGRITGWKDEQGFGFIEPDGGGAQVFVHIKSFTDRRRRPEGGERVSYVPDRNAQGKWRAQDVAFIGESRTGRPQPARRSRAGMPSRPQPPVRGPVAVGLAAAFFCVLMAVAWIGRMPWTLVGLYAAASFVTFMVYGFDKSAARHDRWRTSESRLHLLALLCGWPGALLAQGLLRHKSSKASFQLVFWITVVLNCGLLAWLLSSAGAPLRALAPGIF